MIKYKSLQRLVYRIARVLFVDGRSIQKTSGTFAAMKWMVNRARRALLQRTILKRRERSTSVRDFDLRFGIETTEPVFVEEMEVASPSYLYAADYEPSTPSALTEIFSELPQALNIDYKDFTFIDIGSGKGLVLLVASEFPFRKIVGIEFAYDLYRLSQENIRKYDSNTQRCKNIELLCMDAADYVFPNERLLIYFFHPFHEKIMTRVLDSMETCFKSNNKDIVIVYKQPICADLLDEKFFLNKFQCKGSTVIYRSVSQTEAPS